jgi:5-(aminomethyl)-3-furanmethanol phosphate kinase
MCTIVYKVGGSLLARPDLSQRLAGVLEQPIAVGSKPRETGSIKRLLVVGGGSAANSVRDWDKLHNLGDERAHELALRSMSFNAHLVAAILKNARLVAQRAEARAAWSDAKIAILASAEFVGEEERATGDFLPRSWDVTSDSIAAYIALHWPAAALVLLKSVPLPKDADLETAARQGLVDPYLCRLADRIPRIGWADLSLGEPIVRLWHSPGRG